MSAIGVRGPSGGLPRMRAGALALALLTIACGEREQRPPAGRLSPAAALPRLDPGPSGPVAQTRVPGEVLDAWHLTAQDRRELGGPVAVRAGNLRLAARLHALPAALSVPIPAGAAALQFRVALGTREPRCKATLKARFRGALAERALTRGDWQRVELAPEAPGPTGDEADTLELRLETPGCDAWAALSEIRLRPRDAAPQSRPDLLLVVLDTVRRDHFDCAETTAELMPNLYRSWCQRGLFLEDAWSTTSWTYPAVASMLTGLRPQEHGAQRRAGQEQLELSPRVTTLAEILRWSGYATGAVIANWQAGRGLWRGFDAFVERHPRQGRGFAFPDQAPLRRASGVVDDAIAWLEAERAFGTGEPSFIWLVFLDAHEPVDAAIEQGRLPDACTGIDPLPVRWQGIARHGRGSNPREPRALPCRRALYREALRYLDRELGRLIAFLEDTGRADQTGVVVASDHGEEFWEHAAEEIAAGTRGPRGYGHGHTLYAELVRVPLLAVPPGGLASPRRSPKLASVQDVFATLLGMAGVAAPTASRAENVLRLLREPEPRAWRRHVLSETTRTGPDRSAVTTSALRAVRTEGHGVEVFDRRKDAAEKSPLPANSPLARVGRALLERAERATSRAASPSPADREALRALGYLDE